MTEGIDERELDRVLSDMPEPWRVLPHARDGPATGGILLAYLPTINQTAQLREALDRRPVRAWPRPSEILRRTWHIEAA